jgi:cellulose synthase/poly-beta-1,6-N-acetylglucosamine synthase-like glycosyltransferase
MDLPRSLWCATAVASIMILFTLIARRNRSAIKEVAATEGGTTPPDCMVVIPARNEEALIGRAVKSLPPDSVIVVDDASIDRTAQTAREAGAGVIRAPKLAPSMNGKSSACSEGARVLRTKWILFADADTWYRPGFLESVIASAESNKVDFLSIYLKPQYATFAESVLGPFATALFFFGNRARANPAGAFNGQCVLVRREAYEFVGGHRTILRDLCDDVKLAAQAQRHRMKIALARAERLGYVRIRTGGFYRQAHRFTQVNIFMGLVIVVCTVAIAVWGPAVAWLIVDGQATAAAVFFALPILLFSRWYGLLRALLAPLGIYAALWVVMGSFLKIVAGRPVKWKGRVI